MPGMHIDLFFMGRKPLTDQKQLNKKRGSLKAQLKEGARRRAKRDLRIAEEWFPLEEEVWLNSVR